MASDSARAVETSPLATAASSGWIVVLTALFGAVCALAGALWARQRWARPLRAARLGEQVLLELAEGWIWHTDDRHQLCQWRPPQQASGAAWAAQPDPLPPLWERFEIVDPLPQPGALQARLDARSVITGLRVRWVTGTTESLWRLRAVPRFDLHGEFDGYTGSAVPLDSEDSRRIEQPPMVRLWHEVDIAALALRAGPSGWEPDVLNPQAQQLLNLPARPAPGLALANVLGGLPADLARAASAIVPGQRLDVGAWNLQLLELPAAAGGEQDDCGSGARRLLLLRQTAPASEPDSATLSDQESFTYSISHDLRAPIRVVEGFARILKEDYGRFLDRIGNDHLDRVLAAAARMNSMIDALLALSRLQSQPLSRKPVDLSQLATYIVEDLRSEAPERAASVQIEPGIVVQGDPTLLRIAMDNLLGNAWKYSGQAAQTVIEFRREQRDGRAVLVVADQGAGFDMRFADRLFGVFQRLHSPKDFQGTGVGLASVKRIVRRHGGDIWAESEVGKGARFYFTLPNS